MSVRTDPEDLIPAGAKVAVTEVDIEEDRRTIGLRVSQVGSRRWTEVHLSLDKPFGLGENEAHAVSWFGFRLYSTRQVEDLLRGAGFAVEHGRGREGSWW